jgi:hypothetical protein
LLALWSSLHSLLTLSAGNSEIVAAMNRGALHASASASVAPHAALPAAASSSPAPLLSVEHELAAVNQRLIDVENEIHEAKENRKACTKGSDLWIRADDELKQLRDEKALLLKKEERLAQKNTDAASSG